MFDRRRALLYSYSTDRDKRVDNMEHLLATRVYEKLAPVQGARIESQDEQLARCFKAANEYAKTGGDWSNFKVKEDNNNAYEH